MTLQKRPQKSRFSTFLGGPKRLKTDHFEVKIASSTSNGTFLRLLKKFFGLLRKHSILHRFFKHFQAPHGVSDLRRHETESATKTRKRKQATSDLVIFLSCLLACLPSFFLAFSLSCFLAFLLSCFLAFSLSCFLRCRQRARLLQPASRRRCRTSRRPHHRPGSR